jgi:choline dehydrogenase-like flavoprotein
MRSSQVDFPPDSRSITSRAGKLGWPRVLHQKYNDNRIHHIVRGKFVGGSSGLNYTALVHPAAEDIDAWGKHASGWSWSGLEPYYRKSQTLQADRSTEVRPDYFRLDPSQHGESGPIQTSWAPSIVPVERSLIEAFNKVASTAPPRDPYSGDHIGFAQHLFTVDRRAGFPSRSYATSGYLVPHANRPNLKVLTEASAAKIILNPGHGSVKAVGVMFWHGDGLRQINAKQEIIISASSIQSPRLLELSGVGSPEILRAAGVECVVNLPDVGELLMEHPMSCIAYEMAPWPENITLDSLSIDQKVFQDQFKRLTENGDGLMAGAFGPVGFVPYASHVSPERLKKTIDSIVAPGYAEREPHQRVQGLLASTSAPTIEFVSLPGYIDLENGHTNQSKVMMGAPVGRNACYSTLVSAMYPLARGSTHINSTDSLSNSLPQIDLNILSHEADVDVIAAGMALADRAYKSPLVAGRFLNRVVPPPEVNLEDPEQARAYVRRQVMIFNHNSGTCAMGRVVDERLRVKGVSGLRVVDVSVFPDTISANPMATVYALAEKAADMIKADGPWGYVNAWYKTDLSLWFSTSTFWIDLDRIPG